MARLVFRLAALSALLLLAPSAPPAQSTTPSAPPERVEVRRVHLPVLLEPKRPGGCDGVTADAITVSEDGLALPALHLDQRRLPVEHVLLLDSSQSMVDHLHDVKRAAVEYVSRLPADEPAMLASFDEDLILRCPMSPDRARFREGIQAIRVGWGTFLWDALGQTIAHAESRARRTVLVALTDGCDTEPDRATTAAALIDAAARVPALTIYTIGLDLPQTCPDDGTDPREELSALAQVTGGRYVDIGSPQAVGDVLDRIRTLLDQERFVSYTPPRFGDGPRDRPERQAHRWRRVKLELSEQAGCRIRASATPVRLEGRSEASGGESTGFVYDPARSELRGQVGDVVRDSGHVGRRGAIVAELAMFPSRTVATRSVAAPVPPVGRLVWPGALPEYAWFLPLMQPAPEASGSGPTRPRWSDVPFLVNGRTLLEQRLDLGSALTDQPGLRRWALNKHRERRLGEIERVAGQLESDAERAALDAVRRYVRSEDWAPEAEDLAPYLAAWLGDVPALRLHAAVETWLIDLLLRGARRSPDGSVEASRVERAEELWRRVGALLAEQDTVRTLGLLVPAYDPTLDRVGFYRIVLPRPTTLLNVWHASPEAPRGVQAMVWAMRDPGFRRAMLEERLGVAGVRYRSLSLHAAEVLERAGVTASADEDGGATIEVTLDLESRSGPARRLSLSVVFAFSEFAGVPPAEPLCLVRPASHPALDALPELQRGAAVPCVVAGTRLD